MVKLNSRVLKKLDGKFIKEMVKLSDGAQVKGAPNVVYVSGPMTGLVNLNKPAFYNEAAKLRKLGFIVINPAELDDAGEEMAYLDYLRRDVKEMLEKGCGRIRLLPGWEQSTGATLEVIIGEHRDMIIEEV